jgi:hypothetical protein
VHASGPATDAAAGRADAIKIAKEIGAFGVWNASNNAMVDELVAQGVMCFCTYSQPIENYLRWAPYVWTSLPASTQAYIHRAEYVGRRLAGRDAQWAGDPAMRVQKRKFGIIYFDTDDKAYRPGVDFFLDRLEKEYGVRPVAVVEYHGYPETARSQEEARPLIQKLVASGATSVICACDPFGPIFFTQEATRQAYQPEWIVTGSTLSDTSFFGRLYDPAQWRHAFGISFLTARLPVLQSESYRLLKWHYGKSWEPAGPASYDVVRDLIELFFDGVHLAGAGLTPVTFRDGMFRMPVTGAGGITAAQVSYGDHGIWPWADYIGSDDVTELWWDPTARGPDEGGAISQGLYRYVDMGRRYLPGQHPATVPKAFDPANTVTVYDEAPAPDRWPEYPSPSHRG